MIIQAFNSRRFQLVITTSVFLEYKEILSAKANQSIADSVLDAFLEAPNVIQSTEYYQWDLVKADPDDNKFTDAYLNGQADYLITNDAHFNSIKRMNFPKINIVSADEFLEMLSQLK